MGFSRKQKAACPDKPLLILSCVDKKDADVKKCEFIRRKAIVSESAVVGKSTEFKHVILFNKVQVPH